MHGAGGVGGLLAVVENDSAGNEIYYATYDANGNVSEYIDDTGTVVAHYEYCPFGQLTLATGVKADDFVHRFSTKYLDSETALYYYSFRYYSSQLGRWISRDPIEEQGGLNLYGFVGNRSVNAWDVLGLKKWCCKEWQPVYEMMGESLEECVKNIVPTYWHGQLAQSESASSWVGDLGSVILTAMGLEVTVPAGASHAGMALETGLARGAQGMSRHSERMLRVLRGLSDRRSAAGHRLLSRHGRHAANRLRGGSRFLGAVGVAAVAWQGGNFLFSRGAILIAYRQCGQEVCVDSQEAIPVCVRTWYGAKTEYHCPDGTDLINERNARR